jgi:hypothetical protein
MRRQNNRKLRAVDSGADRAFQSRKPQMQPCVRGRGRFFAIRGGLDIQDDINADNDIQNLQRLKAENAELRNAAVQLALEIRALRRLSFCGAARLDRIDKSRQREAN